jgi:pantetheine-phosphate adenylyltransferase
MKRLAVYAGSFDPPTNGHIDIVRRVQPLFDKLYLVVAENARKTPFFSSKERQELLNGALKDSLPRDSFEVCIHDGLIVDFCKKIGATVLVRGLRAVSDFEVELQMASMNRRLDPKIETFHVMTDEKFFFVSSSLIREVAYHGGELGELVPANVREKLKQKVQSK